MPRTLITGGAGFIGSHLCEHFLSLGHEVICMDNLLTGDSSNIAHIRNQNFLFIKHDVTNYIYVEGGNSIICSTSPPLPALLITRNCPSKR